MTTLLWLTVPYVAFTSRCAPGCTPPEPGSNPHPPVNPAS
jgi:hypothetical protein